MSLISTVTFSSPSTSSGSSSSSCDSSESSSDSSGLSPPSSSQVINVASSSNLEVDVRMGRRDTGRGTTNNDSNKENLEVLVLKVVPVSSGTRTSQAVRYWVAVAVGDRNGSVGVGEHVGRTEKLATKKAEKKAFKNIMIIRLMDNSTVHGRVTGFSGGDCLSLPTAPRGVGIVTTSGMTRKLLELAGLKDCFVTNSWDKLTTVRALSKCFSKLSRANRS